MAKLKQGITQAVVVVGAALSVLLVGAGIKTGVFRTELEAWAPPVLSNPGGEQSGVAAQLGTLAALTPEERLQKLTAIAQGPAAPERNRARYLLSIDLLQQQKPQAALEWLKGLEVDYSLLAAHILRNRARAYEQLGDRAQAEATWQVLLQNHGENPVAVEALLALGQNAQAIARFPAHPRTVEVAQKQLKQTPKNLPLQLLIAHHGQHLPNYVNYLDQLVEAHSHSLKPEDWAAIAFGYWEKQAYAKAGNAYARSNPTPLHAYRIARGWQLGEKEGARAAYQQMIQSFPESEETGLALLRLSRLADPPAAIAYLDQIISRFPEQAGEALADKANLLEKQGNGAAAHAVRKQLLGKYGQSAAAAEYRWSMAQKSAAAKDYKAAMNWAEAIVKQNSESEMASMAGYWLGKWAEQSRQERAARSAYEQVLRQHPDSYYAWRSATRLGWQVGDFNTVRELSPAVVRPPTRLELPAGSPLLQELFQLGQDQDAWELWQVEFTNPAQPSVAEQFTDGVLRIGVGDYLEGMFMLSFLSQREKPAEREEYRALKSQRTYWEFLYPFPYLEAIANWSQERRLNPLLVTALIRQESRFMPGIRSSAGAVGLMQVMPDTAAWIAKQISLPSYRLNYPDDNIKLGTWYLDYTHREYSNNSMLAVASYNAGSGAVANWVRRNPNMDVDEFIEAIPYKETRGYVKSVFGNYWNYLRIYNPEISRQVAQISDRHPPMAWLQNP